MKFDEKEACWIYNKKDLLETFWDYIVTELFERIRPGDTLGFGKNARIFIGNKTYNLLKKHYLAKVTEDQIT